jgi:hypothetical protein
VRALVLAAHDKEVRGIERDADSRYVRPDLHVKHVLGYRAPDRQSDIRRQHVLHWAMDGHGHGTENLNHHNCEAVLSAGIEFFPLSPLVEIRPGGDRVR